MKNSKFTALNTKQMRLVAGGGLTPPKAKGGATKCNGQTTSNSSTCDNQSS